MTHNPSLLSIRPVQVDDYSQWFPYWLAYQNFYQVQLSEQTTLKTWSSFFDPDVKVYAAVACDQQQILGFVHYVFHDSTWTETEFCYLEDLYVTPAARGQQLAKQLIEYVQGQAQARNCQRLYWHTQQSNVTAQRLYDWVAKKSDMIQYRMPV